MDKSVYTPNIPVQQWKPESPNSDEWTDRLMNEFYVSLVDILLCMSDTMLFITINISTDAG